MPPDPPTNKGPPVPGTGGELFFPPFPPVPDGTTIIPFVQFRAAGIQITCIPDSNAGEGEDDIERDALGIPTVEIAKYHETDAPKSDARKRRLGNAPRRFVHKKGKNKGTAPVVDQNGNAVPWYEEWEAGEQFQRTSASQDFVPDERLLQAADDFHKTRRWPDDGITKTKYIWDQFGYFTGLLERDSRLNKKSRGDPADSDFDMDDDDEEFGDDVDVPMIDSAAPEQSTSASRTLPRLDANERSAPLPRVPYDAMDALAETDSRKRRAVEDREARLYRFVDTPDEALTVFMSSYMREKGLIYYMNLLTNTPKVLAFFVRFLLRNRVFPEPSSARALERALDVCRRAEEELPLTDRAAKAFPDVLGKTLKECWGRKREVVVYGGQNLLIEQAEEEDQARMEREREEREAADAAALEELRAHERAMVERLARRQGGNDTSSSSIADGGDVDQSSDANVVITSIASGNTWGTTWGSDANTGADAGWSGTWGPSAHEGDAAADPAPAGWTGQWPADTSAPDEGGAVDTSDTPLVPVTDDVAGVGAAGISWEQPIVEDWTASDKPSTLFPLLGPTALPLTHTTGIVEYSTRRIVSLHPPVIASHAAPSTTAEGDPDSPAPSPGLAPAATQADRPLGTSRRETHGADDPERVEDALDAAFGKVVLEPWPRVLGGDIREPSIKPSSRGPVVLPAHQRSSSPAASDADLFEAGPGTSAGTGAGPEAGAEGNANPNKKPHDPYTSRIVLLVDPPVLDALRVGMGIGAVFVQIARQEDVLGTGAPPKPEGEQKKRKKKKKGANAAPPAGNYWYLEDHVGILPGYYLNDGERS